MTGESLPSFWDVTMRIWASLTDMVMFACEVLMGLQAKTRHRIAIFSFLGLRQHREHTRGDDRFHLEGKRL